MEGINYALAFGMWLGMAIFAIANGYIAVLSLMKYKFKLSQKR